MQREIHFCFPLPVFTTARQTPLFLLFGLISQNEPYTMLHPPSENRTGNDRFYGYAIDLIAALASLYKFNYTFYISPDRKYGSRQPDGKWNGMVGELIQRVSDNKVVTSCS